MGFTTSQVINFLMQFFVIFISTFAGVYTKEQFTIRNSRNKKKKVDIIKILWTTITLSFLLVGTMSYSINRIGFMPSFTLFFLIGASSNKVVEMIFAGTLLKIAFNFLGKSKKNLKESIEETLGDKDA